MELTFYGHSCFMVQIDNEKLLFDPYISPNQLASKINLNEIKPNYIFISHGHEDHVADTEKFAKQSNAKLIGIFEVVSWFQKKGVENIHAMNIGGTFIGNFGKAKMVNAVHSSALPDDTDGGVAAGFVIQTKEKTFYFAGDTALTYDMKLIGEEFNIDFAILPIGGTFTMDLKDAVKCADFVNTAHIIGIHYDTFPPIKINKEDAIKFAGTKNKKLTLLEIGQTIKL